MQALHEADENGDLSRATRKRLQRTLAEKKPVIALGSGCQRIGYDRGGSWGGVVRRARLLAAELRADVQPSDDDDDEPPVGDARHVAFLEQFWWTKLSDETQARHAADRLPEDLRVDEAGEVGLPDLVDTIRTDIAARLVGCLSEGTRCLGSVIAEGKSPVTSWDDVCYRPVGIPSYAYELAARHLEIFVTQVAALKAPRRGLEGDARTTLEAWGIDVDREYPLELARFVDILKLDAVHHHAKWLLDEVFRQDTGRPLSGNVIEWLADLLWLVLSVDAGVPYSQVELAYYLNLRSRGDLRFGRDFSRPNPGEYRGEGEDALFEDIVRLEKTHDVGLSPGEPVWSENARARFTRTMAATLSTMWQQVKAQRAEAAKLPAYESATDDSLAPVVALVSAYDLMVERQLWEVTPVGGCFHIIVPAWYSTDHDRQLVWLLCTITKRAVFAFDTRILTGPGDHGPRWTWWLEQRDDTQLALDGPILIKVNGSPLMRLGVDGINPDVRPKSLKLEGAHRGRLRLATIYAEHDALSTIITAPNETSMLPPELAAGHAMAWDARHWVFFGDRFPDWIPRLRLAQRARADRTPSTRGRRGIGDPDGTRELIRIAVDRRFDWPELALLDTLHVDAHQGDLSGLDDYVCDQYAGHESLTTFLDGVKRHLPWISESTR